MNDRHKSSWLLAILTPDETLLQQMYPERGQMKQAFSWPGALTESEALNERTSCAFQGNPDSPRPPRNASANTGREC